MARQRNNNRQRRGRGRGSRDEPQLTRMQGVIGGLTITLLLGGSALLGYSLGTTKPFVCEVVPAHVTIVAGDRMASPVQAADLRAETEDTLREAIAPGEHIVLYALQEGGAGPARPVALFDDCLDPVETGGWGPFSWFFTSTEARQHQEREDFLGRTVAALDGIPAGTREAQTGFFDRIRKAIRRVERDGVVPASVTFVGGAGDLGAPDPGPRGDANPDLHLIVAAGRYDDAVVLTETLERISAASTSEISFAVVETSLPPERDREGCIAGKALSAVSALFMDITGRIAAGGTETIRQTLAQEWARLGPDGRLDIYVIDKTPGMGPAVYRACRGELTADVQAERGIATITATLGDPETWGKGQNASPIVAQLVEVRDKWGEAPPERVIVASDMLETSLVDLLSEAPDFAALQAAWNRTHTTPLTGRFAGIELDWVALASAEAEGRRAPDAFVDALFGELTDTNPTH